MRLPIGYDNFRDIVHKKLDFVDKTLFIKEVLDNAGAQATVITRPRRFGKTLNLSMLQYFLAENVHGQPTQGLFDGLKIATLGDHYMQHQGKYPVILVTFKSMANENYKSAYASLCNLLSQLYSEHDYLMSSTQLTESDKAVFLSIVEERATSVQVGASLHKLSYYLYKHTGVKPWILIDEYDTPIQAGYLNDYYQPIITLMRQLFGTALKSNDFLERAIITGILRISKESLFSGANNVIVYSLFDSKYSEHFGFTEIEVEELLKKADLSDHYTSIRHWYNGYKIGNSIIYNPWSLINCIAQQGLLKPYWVNTSGNDLVKYLLARSEESVKKDLETIIQGGSITSVIDENMVFVDLAQKRISIWSLLLFTGYLKVIHSEAKRSRNQCELAAPNQEVLVLYQDIVRDWLADPLGTQYLDFLLSLTEGRIEEFTQRLQEYLVQTLSIFDATGHEPGKSAGLPILTCEAQAVGPKVMDDLSQKFYHGFVLGMMVSLSDTHEVKSNRESGYGRYDVMLIPKDPEALGIILEFKTVRDENISLETAAEEALQQIAARAYAAELQQRGIQNILAMGLAFRRKQVMVLTANPLDVLALPIP